MADMKKINDQELENVVGGATRTVYNDAVSYANVRTAPGLDSQVMFKIPNGEKVYTTGNTVKKDGYIWYEIICNQHPNGWISGSLIGY